MQTNRYVFHARSIRQDGYNRGEDGESFPATAKLL